MSPVEFLRGRGLSKTQRILLGLLLMLAAASTLVGLHNAVHGSKDFQWSGARLLLSHTDPWAEFQRGDPQHRFIEAQVPNYLPILYVMLLPLGALPPACANVIWALCNVGFAMLGTTIAARFYGLRQGSAVATVCLMLMATPTRMTIGVGQNGLLVLCLWCIAFLAGQWSTPRGVLVGISYLKFSFAPPLALLVLLRAGWRAVLWTLLPAAVCLMLVWLWIAGVHHPEALLSIAAEPFKVAVNGFVPDPNDATLMGLVELMLPGKPEALITTVGGLLALTICGILTLATLRDRRAGQLPGHMALIATMSYGLFKHHFVDAVVLLLPGCYALARWRDRRAQAVLLVLGYLFYAKRILEALHLMPRWAAILDFGMLVFIFAMTWQMQHSLAKPRRDTVAEETPHTVGTVAA